MISKKLFVLWQEMPKWKKILLAMLGGMCVGLVLGHKAVYLKPIGALFINAIKMMIVPVVFTAIVCAILTMSDPSKMRRVIVKTLLLYGISMAVSTSIGLIVATLIAPGAGLSLPVSSAEVNVGHMPTLVETIVNMIPSNPINAFSSANILQILVFSVFFGISINLAGEKALPVRTFFVGLSAVVYKLAGIVMGFAPYGIFALMAVTTGEYGLKALLP